MSTMGENLKYCGDIMIHVGDIMSSMAGVLTSDPPPHGHHDILPHVS